MSSRYLSSGSRERRRLVGSLIDRPIRIRLLCEMNIWLVLAELALWKLRLYLAFMGLLLVVLVVVGRRGKR